MENKERWRPLGGGMNPSARLKAARSMPSWMQTRGVAYPPPPPPPVNDPPIDPDYEVIEFPGQTYSNAPMQEIKPASGKKCDLCGSSTPSVHCAQCSQNFCPSCDDMYHRHPKRQTHFRKDLDGKQTIVRPPLPPKGEAAQPPVPPPRKNKRTSRTPIPSPLDQSPTSKVGFVGSLKRLVGGRPLPAAPFTANSVSPHMGHPHHQELSPQMGGFQEGMFGDWNLKNHRAGSFSNLHSPGFNPLVQAHSMAQLNCPSCQHGVIWDPWHGNTMGPQSLMGLPPWSGIPPNGTWHSSAFLNRRSSHEQSRRNSLRRHHVQDSSSASEDDDRFVHNRRRNPSPALSRRSRNPHSEYESEEDDREKNWSRSPALTHRISRRASMAEGINRTHRHDDDTLSTYGGRRASHQPTLSRRESMGHPLDKMSKHEYDRNLDRRGSRRNDFDSMTNQNQQRYESEDTRQRRRTFDDSKTSYTEEGRLSRGSNKGFSEFEDPSSNSPRTSEQNDFNEPESRRRKSRRNERFSDTGRRRTSPISYKYGENVVNAHTETPNTVNNLETNGNSAGDRNEEEEEMGPIPETQWECVHCTFINEPGTRVCAICCKTTAKPKSVKSQNVQPDLKGQKDFKSTKRFEEQRTTKVVKDYDEVTITEGLRKMNMGSSPQSTSMQKLQIKSPQKGLQPNDSQKHLTSTGTSPPPQSISTQTYDVTGHKLKRTTSLADYAEWKAPQRSYSKQSLFSDTQSLPVTPPKRRSPEKFNPVDGTAVPPEQPPSVKNMDQLTMQRNLKRAGSQPPDYISTLVQKQVKQGLEMVKLLREAEEQQFSADDLAVALLHCEDGDPVAWLQKNWRNMIDTVVTLGTNYGHERKENTVGTISASEAREALRMHDGNVWAAVTECVEQRQKKYAELLSRGNFSREDIVTVLTANHGNLEAAYMELSKSQLKPFLMRIWGPPQGTDNESGDFTKLAHDSDWEGGKGNKRDEEREVRRILAEGLVQTYSQAELVVKLKNLDFDEEQCIAAAAECNDVEMAVAYLQQECYLCAGKYTMKQMVSMLDCEHICCQECAKNYFTLQITERTINDCVCPFCKEPDISKLEEDKTLHYFSNLDILLKTLVKENVHELFQRKLRDRTLMQDPNFIWCGQCSSGFIANPRQKRLICPDCKNISCASCRKTWQKEHEKMTCKEFKEWLEYNDPENQLERHLAENGITCPKCTTRYVLAKGGCMHLICPHCKHEFCQGCGKPFLMGNNCKLSPFCEKLGLHSHHPRNCLFYLRDKEPKQLQRLLEDNGIDYRKTNENLTNRCNVQILKETDEGFLEAICGFPIEGCGLCRTHFIEHLVCLIKDNKVDPVVVMDIIDAQQELRRHGKSLPTREDFKSDHEYLAVCMKVIKEDIPLE
ncbi:uncharacterized protein LOC106665625 isoform X4 [Cimex lectularius]|uniref:RBR-type E3 ubiquitin transferase n=1 Tax=Cimex lectularius TaxID=79782 RepID=A0A8I6SKH2_CIMLE|nr:uncharacterized protein LOC106665625 isoform X4 [Cimex lectularius]